MWVRVGTGAGGGEVVRETSCNLFFIIWLMSSDKGLVVSRGFEDERELLIAYSFSIISISFLFSAIVSCVIVSLGFEIDVAILRSSSSIKLISAFLLDVTDLESDWWLLEQSKSLKKDYLCDSTGCEGILSNGISIFFILDLFRCFSEYMVSIFLAGE